MVDRGPAAGNELQPQFDWQPNLDFRGRTRPHTSNPAAVATMRSARDCCQSMTREDSHEARERKGRNFKT